MDIEKVWHDACEHVKDKIVHPTLWRAVEMAVPITAEGDQFVVGFSPNTMHMAGHLTSAQHKNTLEAGILASSGKKLQLVIIDGSTPDDWKNFKARQKAADEVRLRLRAKAEQSHTATHSWDGILDQVGRSFSQLQLRQLPQVRAKYLEQVIELISEAMDELYASETPDEATQRALARVIDRVGVITETPPALIALEIQKYRRGR